VFANNNDEPAEPRACFPFKGHPPNFRPAFDAVFFDALLDYIFKCATMEPYKRKGRNQPMKLTQQQAQAFVSEMQAQGLQAQVIPYIEKRAYGYIRRIRDTRTAVIISVSNITDSEHHYTDKTGATHTSQHDPRKTLAHEYTHILQTRRGYYNRDTRGSNNTARVAFNEVVANTIGMLCYPTQANIIDNAEYVNNYLQDAEPLMHHLKSDIAELLPEVRALLSRIGLL